jgi:hypothetical protein
VSSARSDWRSEIYNAIAAAVIALLVWAYANDRTQESTTVTGMVRLAPSDPRELYAEPTAAFTVSLEVRGSRRAIERVENTLRAGLSMQTGSEGVPGTVGTHEVELADAIGNDAAISSTGAEITRATPRIMRVEIGRLVTDQVQVTPVLPRAAVQGEIVVDPPVVTVTMPESARSSLGAITLDALVDTKNLEPGRTHSVDVELKLPESLSRWKELSRVVPPRAKVTFALLATKAEFTLSSVPVEVAIAPAALELYRVSVPPGSAYLQNVVVTGPLASIDRLRSGDFLPAAVVSLDSRTLTSGVRRLPVTSWRLPEGVTLISAAGIKAGAGSDAPIEVLVAVEPRSAQP